MTCIYLLSTIRAAGTIMISAEPLPAVKGLPVISSKIPHSSMVYGLNYSGGDSAKKNNIYAGTAFIDRNLHINVELLMYTDLMSESKKGQIDN